MYEAQISAQTTGKAIQNLLIEVTPTKVICHPDPNKKKSLKATYEFPISKISSISFQRNAPNKNWIAPKGEWRHLLILAGVDGLPHLGGLINRSAFYFRSVRDGESVRDEISNAQSKLEEKLGEVEAGEDGDIVSSLQELADLKEKGLIDDEEFKSAKKKLLE